MNIKFLKKLKSLSALLSAFILVFSSVQSFAAANVIKIDGTEAVIPDGMGEIRERDDRTFVPLRFVSEFLKYTVWYDDASKTAYVSSDEKLICVQNGNSVLFSVSKSTGESTSMQMDTAAYIDEAEGRTYLPIRFLAEAMNYTVGWDEASKTVTLDIIK